MLYAVLMTDFCTHPPGTLYFILLLLVVQSESSEPASSGPCTLQHTLIHMLKHTIQVMGSYVGRMVDDVNRISWR